MLEAKRSIEVILNDILEARRQEHVKERQRTMQAVRVHQKIVGQSLTHTISAELMKRQQEKPFGTVRKCTGCCSCASPARSPFWKLFVSCRCMLSVEQHPFHSFDAFHESVSLISNDSERLCQRQCFPTAACEYDRKGAAKNAVHKAGRSSCIRARDDSHSQGVQLWRSVEEGIHARAGLSRAATASYVNGRHDKGGDRAGQEAARGSSRRSYYGGVFSAHQFEAHP